MRRQRRWPCVMNARVWCPMCEQWYTALVSRAWYVHHWIIAPQTPVRTCSPCLRAISDARKKGGSWRAWRNWERAAADEGTPEGPPLG